jgi:hypothetical protein
MVSGSSQKNNLYCPVYVNKKSTEEEHIIVLVMPSFSCSNFERSFFNFSLGFSYKSSGLSRLNTHFGHNFGHFFCVNLDMIFGPFF